MHRDIVILVSVLPSPLLRRFYITGRPDSESAGLRTCRPRADPAPGLTLLKYCAFTFELGLMPLWILEVLWTAVDATVLMP